MNGPERAVAAWIRKAESDRKAIRACLQSADPPWDAVCFHAQQAAEKYLKALLVAQGIDPERTHDLIRLLHSVAMVDASLAGLERDCRKLNSFAVDVRYPDLEEQVTEAMAREAVDAADRICQAIRQRLRPG